MAEVPIATCVLNAARGKNNFPKSSGRGIGVLAMNRLDAVDKLH